MRDTSFQHRLRVSEDNALDSLWLEFYTDFATQKGGNISNIKINRDVELQKRGFDKLISFNDGREFIIEEKVRYYAYNDVLVERWEDERIGKVGWGWDTHMMCDYLAYAIWPSSLCIFINFPQLQTLVMANENVYMKRKQFKNAEGGYLSTGFILSFDEIKADVPDSIFIQK